MTIKIPEWYCDPPCNRVYYGGPLDQCPHQADRAELLAGRHLTLISFGYLHLDGGSPPEADRVEDVRRRLRDPAAARINGILDLDGRDERVQQVVLGTPGAAELVDNLMAYAMLPAGPRTIAIGCAGGKHRAASLVEILAARLREHGQAVDVDHRHAHLPRVLTQ